MKTLLDTHAFLWYLMEDDRLSPTAKTIIDTQKDLYFSIVNLWEISIKVNIGKLKINRPIEDLFGELQYLNIKILPILDQDIKLYAKLPVFPNHRDPFDRMLITQAINRSLALMSRDPKIDLYSIQRIWE